MSVSTADLWDERGDELQSCSVQLRHYGGRTAFTGVISTVRCHRDNALVKAALAEPGDGRVLVVDGGGSLESALMGDLIAASAVAQGWAGVVIHGAVRDVAALRDLPLGALALGSNPRKSAKDGVGERDVPVAFGGAEFVPGQTRLGRRGRRGRHPPLTPNFPARSRNLHLRTSSFRCGGEGSCVEGPAGGQSRRVEAWSGCGAAPPGRARTAGRSTCARRPGGRRRSRRRDARPDAVSVTTVARRSVGVGAALDEAALLEGVDDVGHRARCDPQVAGELAGSDASCRATTRSARAWCGARSHGAVDGRPAVPQAPGHPHDEVTEVGLGSRRSGRGVAHPGMLAPGAALGSL